MAMSLFDEKQKFFAQLDAFDDAITETESETELCVIDTTARKRRRLNENADPTLSKARPAVLTTLATVEGVTETNVPTLQRIATHSFKATSRVEPTGCSVRQSTTGMGATALSTRLPGSVDSAQPNIPSLRHAATDTRTNEHKRHYTRSIRRTNSEPEQTSVTKKARASDNGSCLFKGLAFYFLPNDDVAKVRKLRIQSAISHGATWIRSLDATITHIIVDSGIAAATIEKALRDKVNTSTISVVGDKWLIECLNHKAVRNPNQGRFQIKGANWSRKPVVSEDKDKIAQACNPISMHEKDHQHDEVDAPSRKSAESTDELSQIVRDMRNADHLPFDEELDLERFVSFSSGDEQADDDRSLSSSSYASISVPKENKGFVCMESHTGKSDNPNNRTIDVLQQMATHYDRVGDHWRTTAYRKAISALRKQDTLVSTKKQAKAVFGIGNRLADKIEEIVTTDRLQRLESVLADPDDKVLQLFMGIYDVGFTQAKLWMNQGSRTLDHLRANAKLSPNQQIGIDHYKEFQQRIPRAEVERHGAIVQRALKRADKNLEAIVGGSYRRGMPDSGDIDIMITHPTADLSQLRKLVFENAVPQLFKAGFMKCVLATSRSTKKQLTSPMKGKSSAVASTDASFALSLASSSSTGTKLLGASALTNFAPWRRIDLLLVPACSLGANLIYFTGNDIFNRSMRLLASKKGMRLNQHGLYKNVMRGPNRVKETEGELVEGRSEKRIFEILGVPWRRPEERRC